MSRPVPLRRQRKESQQQQNDYAKAEYEKRPRIHDVHLRALRIPKKNLWSQLPAAADR
jgi:hypothetical protein